VLPFGVSSIDSYLPEGGVALGALHEVAGGGNGAIDGAAASLFAAELGGMVVAGERYRLSPRSETPRYFLQCRAWCASV